MLQFEKKINEYMLTRNINIESKRKQTQHSANETKKNKQTVFNIM
jgi:hypothetical protein